jgi:hypothetical protein
VTLVSRCAGSRRILQQGRAPDPSALRDAGNLLRATWGP